MKYLVKYALPYVHHVVVGIEADSAEDARAKAEVAFDSGDIWDNTPTMPLLHDSYEEGMLGGGESPPLEFEVKQHDAPEFPVPHGPFMIPEYRCEEFIEFDGGWIKE